MSKKPKTPQYKKLGYATYSDYLKSDHWKDVRKRFFASGLARRRFGSLVCCFCWEPRPLALHHRTYKRLGRKRLNDLALLCDECHLTAHTKQAKNLWVATKKASKAAKRWRKRVQNGEPANKPGSNREWPKTVWTG